MDSHYNREMRIIRLCNIAKKIGAQTNLEQTLQNEIRRMGVSEPTGRSYIKAVVARLSTGKEASWEPDPTNQVSDFT